LKMKQGKKLQPSLEIFFIFQKVLQLAFLRPILVWVSFVANAPSVYR